MFGYVVGNQECMNEEERRRYQAVYCGLCHQLGERYGAVARLCLTYDMAFLVLLLSSLYEPEEAAFASRCAVHPLQKRSHAQNRFTEYAANLSILLVYHKCMDDWHDERKAAARLYAGSLQGSYERAKARRPRQCEAVQEAMARLGEIEQDPAALPDTAANCFGALMGELFVYDPQDHWAQSLRRFGDHLGRFIYMMDAVMDYEDDLKSGGYNPLRALGKAPQEMQESLVLLIGTAAQEFEKLPLIQDQNLLRNILYGGVWQKYNAVQAKKKEKEQ